MAEVGKRVVAVSHTDKDDDSIVYIFGFGVYEGDFVPEEDNKPAGVMGEMMYDEKYTNPRIKLDNDKVVWGCECWWGSEEGFKETYKDCTLVEVDIDAKRTEIRS